MIGKGLKTRLCFFFPPSLWLSSYLPSTDLHILWNTWKVLFSSKSYSYLSLWELKSSLGHLSAQPPRQDACRLTWLPDTHHQTYFRLSTGPAQCAFILNFKVPAHPVQHLLPLTGSGHRNVSNPLDKQGSKALNSQTRRSILSYVNIFIRH